MIAAREAGSVRVLFILPNLEAGGAERVALTLLRRLDRRRFEPALALLRRKGAFLAELPSGLRLVDMGVARARYAAPALARLVRRERPDIVFSTLGHLNLVLALLRPFLPRATRIVARESGVASAANARLPHPRLFDFLYRRLYNRFDAVVAQSRFMADDLERAFGVQRGRIEVINNPVDAQRVLALAAEAPRDFPSPGVLNLLAVGRLTAVKGYERLLRALALLGPGYRLAVLGEGPLGPELRRRASELGVEARVDWLGFRANPYGYMARADALVMSSFHEGFPNAAVEALCCGTPVAAFDCPGGTGEIVEHGLDGFLAPEGDEAALAAAAAKAAGAGFERDVLRERARRRFAAEAVVPRYERLFAALAAGVQGENDPCAG